MGTHSITINGIRLGTTLPIRISTVRRNSTVHCLGSTKPQQKGPRQTSHLANSSRPRRNTPYFLPNSMGRRTLQRNLQKPRRFPRANESRESLNASLQPKSPVDIRGAFKIQIFLQRTLLARQSFSFSLTS